MAEFRWRTALPADVPVLVALMTEFYRESDLVPDRARAGVAFDAIVADSSLGRVWLLQAGGAAVGYMVLTLGFSMEYGGRDAFLDDLYLKREYRGAGLGRAALEIFIDACRGLDVRAAHLEVGRANVAAGALYRKFGFADNDRQLLTCRFKRPLHGAVPTKA